MTENDTTLFSTTMGKPNASDNEETLEELARNSQS